MKRIHSLVGACVFGALTTGVLATGALAQVPDNQANRLGADLTPVGAEKAGEDGIPAWTGGLQSAPAGITFKQGERLADPFANDPVKFTVTGANAAQYDAVLTDGYKTLLKTYPDYKMNVYESRRSCAYPDHVYAATKNNARSRAVGGGNGSAARSWRPFPRSQQPLEKIWNHTLLARSSSSAFGCRRHAQRAITPDEVRDDPSSRSDPRRRSRTSNTISYYYRNPRRADALAVTHSRLRAINAASARQASVQPPHARCAARQHLRHNPAELPVFRPRFFDGYNGAPTAKRDGIASGRSRRIQQLGPRSRAAEDFSEARQRNRTRFATNCIVAEFSERKPACAMSMPRVYHKRRGKAENPDANSIRRGQLCAFKLHHLYVTTSAALVRRSSMTSGRPYRPPPCRTKDRASITPPTISM